MLIDTLANEAERVFSANHDLVARLVSERRRFENWLQLEILKRVIPAEPLVEIERPFPEGRDRCDFWSPGSSGREDWVELKLCVTNYCSEYTNSLSARPITNQISDVIRDSEKLARIPKNQNRHILLVAYPLPVDYRHHGAWGNHLARISSCTAKLEEKFSTAVTRKSKTASITSYVISI